MKNDPLLDIISAQKGGVARGITSICSANPEVLRAAVTHARLRGLPLLVESTCNQVNQEGGYTGQTPAAFSAAMRALAEQGELAPQQLILGGDHLGPNPWRHEAVHSAMAKARVLVRDYVRAGYRKIHLDASMHCAGDDRTRPLPVPAIAERTAQLALAAEISSEEGHTAPPLYIIGTEVPAPGGVEEAELAPPKVTTPEDVAETIAATRQAFVALDLESAWERVIGVVVQPGVEYGNETLFEYDRQAAAALSRFIKNAPVLVFEAHSTDYQTAVALRRLVEDQFAILKVGPALTFAFREAVFALADVEENWLGGGAKVTLSQIRQVLDKAMLANPRYWETYYPGDGRRQSLARQFSLSDRIRYYWPVPQVQAALDTLFRNLAANPIPLPLLSQYLPRQYQAIREGRLGSNPQALIAYAVAAVLDDYAFACGSQIDEG